MATNLVIDLELLSRVLAAFIARQERRLIVDLFGTLDWDDAYDYKAERSR